MTETATQSQPAQPQPVATDWPPEARGLVARITAAGEERVRRELLNLDRTQPHLSDAEKLELALKCVEKSVEATSHSPSLTPQA